MKPFIELDELTTVNIEFIVMANLTKEKDACWVKVQEGDLTRNFKLPPSMYNPIKKALLDYERDANGS